jgi:PAT family beta-lactamase induction signal transducer AmpG
VASSFWVVAFAVGLALVLASLGGWFAAGRPRLGVQGEARGPVFGTLLDLVSRPGILPVVIFILTFKLADTSMGFMVKPFWVDVGFSASEIGLVSVNIGLGLSIAGGVVGGTITDRVGIFRGLWGLGLFQALSNLGYAAAAHAVGAGEGATVSSVDRVWVYGASALESFTGGLGTGAFLAFLMAIVNRRAAATEYAILSSVFALGRSVAGWLGGFGADAMGYPSYFLLTFFLAFPAYALLPSVRRMMGLAETLNHGLDEPDHLPDGDEDRGPSPRDGAGDGDVPRATPS